MATVRTFNPNPHNMLEVRRALQGIRIQVPPSVYNETRAPEKTDDITKGWRIGSKWIWSDANVKRIYECADNTEANAVWKMMVDLPIAAGGVPSLIKGGLLAYDDVTNQWKVVAVGADGQVLTADDAQTTGIKWAAPISKTRVFITGVTGLGAITDKVFQDGTVPPNKVLTAFKSDNDEITLTLEIHGLTDTWAPVSVTVSGGGATPKTSNSDTTDTETPPQPDWVQVGSSRIWTAQVTLTDANTSGTITATMSDGDTATVAYTRAADPPLVLTAVFDTHPNTTGGSPLCPALQTQVKSGDTVRITGTTESHANEVYVKNAGVSDSLQGPFTVTAGAFDFTCNVGSRTSASQTATLYAKVTGGTAGADKITTNTIKQDQTAPTFTGGAQSDIAYPTGQEALKDVETCNVTVTHTNAAAGDTYLYAAPGGELTIPNTTTYAATKTGVARVLTGTDYRETGTNYTLTATRTTLNGKSATANVTVKIAHTTPVITIAGATTRLGTDDGTLNYKDHTITIQSSQANLSTYTASVTLAQGAGDTATWQGTGWSASGSNNYTRTLRVADGDIKAGGQAANNYTWGACSVKNRAGKEAVTVTTNTTYQLGGFATRTLTQPAAPAHEIDIGVFVVDTAKLTAVNLSKGGSPTQTYEANITEHNNADPSLNNYFTISTGADVFDADNKYYHNSDKLFSDSNTSGTAQISIGEAA